MSMVKNIVTVFIFISSLAANAGTRIHCTYEAMLQDHLGTPVGSKSVELEINNGQFNAKSMTLGDVIAHIAYFPESKTEGHLSLFFSDGSGSTEVFLPFTKVKLKNRGLISRTITCEPMP